MKKLTSNEIRQSWIDYFKSKGHYELEPASLVPIKDKSLQWINSGVATLKNYFSGKDIPPNPRLVNSQKSIRTNDFYNVGLTSRHHTLFEMLGNFSIGDYFKMEAIEYGMDYLTNILGFKLDDLYFTVFNEDDETYNKWISLGVKKEHIIKCGKDRNFWDVGSGPCGPNTEIFYDRGPKYDPDNIGIKLFYEDIENDRYIEIWNIVFSQFNNDGNNNYQELTLKNIDTGAGLERLACVLQDVPTNFDTDLFLPIIRAVEKFCVFKYDVNAYFTNDLKQNRINYVYKVIADHMRATVFAIADGVVPSHKERGYILRRLIRRFIALAKTIDIKPGFVDAGVGATIKTLSQYYPYLVKKEKQIKEILDAEINNFNKTLEQGFKLFNEMVKSNKATPEQTFKLIDTYGFPIELIKELAEEKKLKIDFKAIDELFKKHQEVSRSQKAVIAMEKQNNALMQLHDKSVFVYDTYQLDAKIIKLFDENYNEVKKLNGEGYVVLDKTCCYATSGGQLCDIATFNDDIEVIEITKGPNLQHIHHVVDALLEVGQVIHIQIDKLARDNITRNHSVEHLIHASLKKIIDPNIKQEGAFKSPDKVTFDFQYHVKLSDNQIKAIQDNVNMWINDKYETEIIFTTMEKALELGALAYFEDVYKKIKGDLRVVKIGNISTELCGGTHVHNTSDIQQFLITNFSSKGSGSWRIEAITSKDTINKYLEDQENELNKLVKEIKGDYKTFTTKSYELDQMLTIKAKDIAPIYFKKHLYDLSNVYKQAKFHEDKQKATLVVDNIKCDLLKVKSDVKVLETKDVDSKNIVNAITTGINEDTISLLVILNTVTSTKKVQYFMATNPKNKVNLNDLLKQLNPLIDGKGGGRPNTVQGGSDKPDSLKIIKDFLASYKWEN